jgi:glycosyltransferase involved in cell wall biosynthesis
VKAARRADVVFGVGSTALSVGAVSARLSGRPFVYRSIGDPAYWGAVRGASIRVGLPLRSAAFVGALFPEAREFMLRRYRLRSDRIGVIPSAVDISLFPVASEAERTRARETLGCGDGPVIGVVGALSPEKDPALALEVVAVLAERSRSASSPRPTMVVVGDGPLRGALEEHARREAIPVQFLGVRADIPDLLPAFDCVLMTSRTEGIPRAAIEAGLRGLPVVGTRAGGLGFVVEDGVTGFVLDRRDPVLIADAVGAAIDDRVRLGQAGRERCSRLFDLDQVADRWAEALSAAVSGAGGPVEAGAR